METENKMTLPEKLTFLRKQNGLTQIELAEKLNVSRQAISKWEVGTAVPGIDSLKALGKLYGVTIDSLVNDDTPPSYLCANKEHASPKPETSKKNRYRFLLITIIVMAITAILCAAKLYKRQQDPVSPVDGMMVVPAEGLIVVEDSDYTTYTFSFD